MTSMGLLLWAIALLGASGLAAWCWPRQATGGQRVAATLLGLGSALGLVAVGQCLAAPAPVTLEREWWLPLGRFAVGVDGLSAVFLLPVFVVPALGAWYGLGYWPLSEHPHNGRRLCLFYGLLAAGMALVVIARDAVLFLIAWELMALAAFFAATTDDDDPEVRRAGWVYLVATHLGTICLIAMFALLRHYAQSFALAPLAAGTIPAAAASWLFVLALLGFGFKAGLMPLHVWLPGAHANAPSHVSAVMSGVMLKMGVYGIVRISGLLPAPAGWWGGVLLGVGAATGVLGIAFALGQSDLKRLLAYSSIENLGIVAMGVGLALLGRTTGRAELIVLGLGGALLHVWNHSLFKSLLFLNAGATIHTVHTRQIDRLGGLAKRMPQTAVLFFIGAVAICGLPPLNGFASELLLYLGLFGAVLPGTAAPGLAAAGLAAAALALIGALAVAGFVRLGGAVFLGEARSDAGAHAHDPGPSLFWPMAILAGGCIALGLWPALALPCLQGALAAWAGPGALPAGPLGALELAGLASSVLIALALLLLLGLRLWLRGRPVGSAGTWDCGYARPAARMQYTSSSFGQTLVELFTWMLWPIRRAPRLRALFPAGADFAHRVPDTVLDRLVLPVFGLANRFLPWLRLLQQGRTQIYLLYILGIVLALLLWGITGS